MDSAPAQDILDDQKTPTPSDAPAPTLSLADLQNLLLVVGVACKRGAVQPSEMKTVGEVYERVESYVKHVTSQQSESK